MKMLYYKSILQYERGDMKGSRKDMEPKIKTRERAFSSLCLFWCKEWSENGRRKDSRENNSYPGDRSLFTQQDNTDN